MDSTKKFDYSGTDRRNLPKGHLQSAEGGKSLLKGGTEGICICLGKNQGNRRHRENHTRSTRNWDSVDEATWVCPGVMGVVPTGKRRCSYLLGRVNKNRDESTLEQGMRGEPRGELRNLQNFGKSGKCCRGTKKSREQGRRRSPNRLL